jgi:hypothetical protein
MDDTDDTIWLAFEALAKTYPQDNGVRMTADLTRWLLQERQRLGLPTPPVMEKVVNAVAEEIDAAAIRPHAPAPGTNQ